MLQQKCAQYLLLNGTTMQDILGEDYDSTEDYFRSKGIYQLGMDGMIPFYWASAASGLVLDIFKTCGPDSYAGMLTSILMSCTETIFYTMSVYFLAAKVTKTRYTLPGALLATLAGTVASIFLAGKM